MIGIVCFWDRAATPYLAKYEKMLQEQNLKYEVIFWKRMSESEIITVEHNYISINLACTGSKLQKIGSFLKWRTVAKKLIRDRNYDQLIVLSTIPAVLLYSTLIGKYREKYIFDIRDYTLEKNPFFKAVVMALVRSSCLTPISSKGYLRWLGESDKIMVNHNITIENQMLETCDYRGKKVYNIGFVGNVRLDAQTRALLLSLKDCKYFEQYFYGRIVPGCDIEELKQTNNIRNLYLPGPFTVEDKPQIYENIDIINCVYANAAEERKLPLGDSTPLPNRLYDAITFYRPMVASRGTYLAELIQEYHIGCCINGFEQSAPEEILQYLLSFDRDSFVDGCNRLRQTVMEEEAAFRKCCQEIFQEWK